MLKKLIIALIIIVTVLVSCSPYPGQTHAPTIYIVSVGLDYLNSEAPDLVGCPDDALEFGSCLSDIYRQRGFEAKTSYLVQYSAEADKAARDYPMADAILGAISGIPSTEDDLIIFYYSGHGDVGENGNAFLAAGSETGDYEELPMAAVFSALETKKAPAVAVIDACYSGAMAEEGGKSIWEAFASLFSRLDLHSVKVIAASGSDELSYMVPVFTESGEQESHGALTASILEILGWRHTSINTRTVSVSGCEKTVYGTVGYSNQSITADEFFEELSGNWRYYEQTPTTNQIPVDIMLLK